MRVHDEQSARAYLRAWGDRLRPGVLEATIDGLRARSGVMTGCARYSDAERADNEAALSVLRAAR